jgi:hypothetical protein
MKTPQRVLAILAIAFGADGLAAQKAPKKTLLWVRDYDAAFAEAKERNVPVMVAFIQDGEPQNEQMPAEVYPNSKVMEASRLLINLIASRGTAAEHGEAVVTEGGEKRTVCAKFGIVSCLEHQKIERRAFLEFTQGEIDTPAHVFASPDGKEMFRADDFVDAAELVRMMKQAVERVGPGVKAEDYQQIQRDLREGDDLLAKKAIGAAAKKYATVAAKAYRIASVERARERLAEIDRMGASEIAECDQKLQDKDYLGAYQALERVARVFKGVRAEKDARSRLAALDKNPEAGEVRRVALLDQKARPLMEQAETLLLKGSIDKAAELYRKVAQAYPATPSASVARERLAALGDDPEGAPERHAGAMERDCKEWLALARDYARNGLAGKAEEYASKVIEKYPGSPYAKEAEKLLAEIRK